MKYRFIVGIGLLIVLFVILASCFSKSGPIALEDQNMDIVKLSYFAFREGDWTSFADLHSPGYIQHSPGFDDPITYSDYELSCRIVHNRLPDLKIRIVDIFSVKDKVAVRSVWKYQNDSYQFRAQYPKGVAQGSEIAIFKIKDNKIIEEWCEHDPSVVKRFVRIYRSITPYEE